MKLLRPIQTENNTAAADTPAEWEKKQFTIV